MSKDRPTDRQLAKALRQAALRIEQQASEINSLTPTTKPLPDKLSVFDFIPLFRKITDNQQTVAIMKMVEKLYETDNTILMDSDWTLISRVISGCKK